MTITITAFERSPDGGRGLARDTRIRWALEELGLPYEVRLVPWEALKAPENLARQPFGQIPSYEEDGVVLFETGAIVLHLAQRHPGLLPEAPKAKALAISWLFAALNSVEPVVLQREVPMLTERDKPWHAERLPMLDARVAAVLARVAAALGGNDWLAGEFSAGDLTMVSVLQRLKSGALLTGAPSLAAYVARAEARPAYGRAFAAQWAVNGPPGAPVPPLPRAT
ncbi:glutathione S-transferase family protein [Neotabrizicola sp. sgz301269]|uniref:glutathione S-transferase family protein n=1 Tax=Neotabrizicola sp. sgz301269 TaxID=3276282 RepID=UPI00376FF21C